MHGPLSMQDYGLEVVEAIKFTVDPALLLATWLMRSISNVLNVMKDPRRIPFFLYGSALGRLRENDHEGFWREVGYGIREARREINAFSAHVANMEWDNFDRWFIKRGPRLDELHEFHHKVYKVYLDGLDVVEKNCLEGCNATKMWEILHDLTTFCRGRTSLYVLDILKSDLGNKVMATQKAYSFIKSRNDEESRKLYLICLDDMIKKPDETINDILSASQGSWGNSITWHCKLYGLYWLLKLVTTGSSF